MLKQVPVQKFESDCKKAIFYVENDMALGSFHDFLMLVKGHMVDLMVKAQKEEQDYSDAQKKSDCSQEE